MPSSSFTIDAWLLRGNRWRHHRVRDHYGQDETDNVVLSTQIGRYPAGTSVQDVLADMIHRLSYLEDDHVTGSFTIDAVLHGKFFTIDSVKKKTISGSFTLNAFLNHSASFTIDAYIVGKFTIDAILV